jgi:hypothetical protein
VNRRIGVSGGKKLLHVGIAIRDIPMGALNRPSARTRGKRSRRVGVWGIGVSGSKKLLQLEVAIRDIPTRELCGPQSGDSGGQVSPVSGIGTWRVP